MKVCVVSAGVESVNIRLQPWRFLHEFCRHVVPLGVQAKVISGGYPRLSEADQVDGVPIRRLKHVRVPPLWGNAALQAAVVQEAPDAVLWHVGLTSSLHLNLKGRTDRPIVGIFTSPIYGPRDFLRLGVRGLVSDFGDLYIHLLGALIPARLVRNALQNGALRAIIVLSDAVKGGLIKKGISPDRIVVIPPGIDEGWLKADTSPEVVRQTREELGFAPQDFVVVYLGSPRPIRGLDTLVRAVSIASHVLSHIELLVLSRRRGDELASEEQDFRNLAGRLGIGQRLKVVSGFLPQEAVIRYVASADVVALPFKLVPSDVPLSVLEAMALGKPVVSTVVDGIPELLSNERGLLVRSNDQDQLAQGLVYLAQHPEERARMGVRAKEYARAQSPWPEVALKIMQVISSRL